MREEACVGICLVGEEGELDHGAGTGERGGGSVGVRVGRVGLEWDASGGGRAGREVGSGLGGVRCTDICMRDGLNRNTRRGEAVTGLWDTR